MTLWVPQVIEGLGVLDPVQSTLLTAVPCLVAGIAMLLNANHLDRTSDRRLHILDSAVVDGAGLILAVSTGSPVVGSSASVSMLPASCRRTFALEHPDDVAHRRGSRGGFRHDQFHQVTSGLRRAYLAGWVRDKVDSHTAGSYLLGVMFALYHVSTFAYLDRARPHQ